MGWRGGSLAPLVAAVVADASTFRFRSEMLQATDNAWEVLDTISFPNGSVRQWKMHCELIAEDRWILTADDMPGGTEGRLRDDCFDFSPYIIRTPVLGPLRVPLRNHDSVQCEGDGTMTDTIELRFLGVRVGRVTMRLQRSPANAKY